MLDDAVSHIEEMAPFPALLQANVDFTTSLVPAGKGELLAVKRA